jgi:hypothetical protein
MLNRLQVTRIMPPEVPRLALWDALNHITHSFHPPRILDRSQALILRLTDIRKHVETLQGIAVFANRTFNLP